jgi:UPF0716 protein FxsA
VLLRLFLLFTLIPLAELILLVWIGAHTSWQFTLALIILPGLLGAAVARHQGLRCWRLAQQQLSRGELPTDALLDGLMILIAGVLLITPGVLTDSAGLLLLAPPIRQVVRRYVARRLQSKMVVYSRSGGAQTNDETVIDVEHGPASDRQS